MLSYFYGFLILRSEQVAGTYSVARLQVAMVGGHIDVYICVHTAHVCICIYVCMNMYMCVGVCAHV